MKIVKTNLDGVIVIEPDFFTDARGFFFEAYNKKRFEDAGLFFDFVQDNLSKSQKNTIRGLHYQTGEYAQGKLCQAVTGKVLDVAVDIRNGSPTYGQYFSVELSGDNHKLIWIPPGFAHGFSVLSDEAIFSYKCTAFYSKKDERAIIFNDKDLNIDWMITDPLVSAKDLEAKKFKDIDKEFYYSKDHFSNKNVSS